MGGGISVLMPDMAKKLSEDSLKKFHELENDCVLNNLTPVDMYLFLTTKYEQLLLEEKDETMRLMKEQARQKLEMSAQLNSSALKVENLTKVKKIKKISRRKSWGVSSKDLPKTSSDIAKLQPTSVRSVAKGGKVKKPISPPTSPKSLFSVSTDANDDIDKRSFAIDQKLPTILQHSEHTASLPVLCVSAAPAESPASPGNNLTGMSDLAFECKLCRKIFDTKNMLDTHYAYSQMHAKNIQDRDAKFVLAYKNAEKLAKLARETVLCFQEKVALKKAMRGKKEDGFMSLNRYRWRYAVSRTIDRFLSAHYEQVLETLSFTPFDSTDVKLLYSGTKLYWRVKSTFSIHIYLHVASDTVEIIPQLLPDLEVLSSEKREFETVQSLLERKKVSKRIYLSHKMLKDLIFGLPKSLADAGTTEATLKPAPLPVFDPLATTPEYVSDDEEEEENSAGLTPIINESVNEALGLFVLNRIKVDYVNANNKTIELRNALYFDCPSKADTPVLEFTPPQSGSSAGGDCENLPAVGGEAQDAAGGREPEVARRGRQHRYGLQSHGGAAHRASGQDPW